jgi:hypothetical protein
LKRHEGMIARVVSVWNTEGNFLITSDLTFFDRRSCEAAKQRRRDLNDETEGAGGFH